MTKSYERKVAIVTGSSRGIGAATIKEFAKLGYNVVINYLNSKEKAMKLKDDVEKDYNVEALVIKADVSEETDVIRLLNEIIAKFGRIDVLVNNAGISIDTVLEEKTVDNFKRILDTNLIGTFLMCKYFGNYMFSQGVGSIINISSTNAIDSYYTYSMDYDASKAGVISLTHNFANQFAPKVRVNTIAPGWVKTDALQKMDKEQINFECKKILLGRFANDYEIAKVIVSVNDLFYINDSIIKVDGGRIV